MLDQAGFDAWAAGYDAAVSASAQAGAYPFAGYDAVLEMVFRGVMAGGCKSVLDLGFGTGALTARLYDAGLSVTGVDFSAAMCAAAQEKMPRAHLLQHDFSRGLPDALASERFDAVVCTYALHHLTDGQKLSLLRALQAQLNPGGRIFIGDIAFPTRAALEACRKKSGDEWDEEEIYLVADELLPQLDGACFVPVSYCAGVLTLAGAEN